MSLNANELVRLIKKAALEAVKASDPSDIVTGEVVSVKPMAIKIDQKITLPQSMLVPTSAVLDRDIEFEALPIGEGHETEQAICETSHSHGYKGGFFKVRLALRIGEKVLLIRRCGGQKYIVLDRVLDWSD